jgi:hypothetical protein
MDNYLNKELSFFHTIQGQLKNEYPNGGFAVIKDDTLLGVWSSREDGIKEGLAAFGIIPFLVKDILENPNRFINFSRNIKFVDAVSYH